MVSVIDHVFIDPERKFLTLKLEEATLAANSGSDVKSAKIPPIQELWGTEFGHVETNGGGKDDFFDYTARVGLAWWTDLNRRKHVRILSDQTKPAIKQVVSIFGEYSYNKPAYWFVYSSRPINSTKLILTNGILYITCKCGLTGEPEKIEWTEGCCKQCREIKAYEEETGFRPAVGKK